jgi:hypothetical protein
MSFWLGTWPVFSLIRIIDRYRMRADSVELVSSGSLDPGFRQSDERPSTGSTFERIARSFVQ